MAKRKKSKTAKAIKSAKSAVRKTGAGVKRVARKAAAPFSSQYTTSPSIRQDFSFRWMVLGPNGAVGLMKNSQKNRKPGGWGCLCIGMAPVARPPSSRCGKYPRGVRFWPPPGHRPGADLAQPPTWIGTPQAMEPTRKAS